MYLNKYNKVRIQYTKVIATLAELERDSWNVIFKIKQARQAITKGINVQTISFDRNGLISAQFGYSMAVGQTKYVKLPTKIKANSSMISGEGGYVMLELPPINGELSVLLKQWMALYYNFLRYSKLFKTCLTFSGFTQSKSSLRRDLKPTLLPDYVYYYYYYYNGNK